MSGDRIPEQQLTFKNFNLVQPAVKPGSAAPGLFRRWRRPKPRLLPAGIAGEIMKYVDACPFADPDAAARKLVEIGNVTEPVQDGRLYVELINAAFLNAGGSPDEYRAGMERAIANGWLWRHDSGTYSKFTPAGAELFA